MRPSPAALPRPRRHGCLRPLLLALLLSIVALNALAFVHARAALRFVPPGSVPRLSPLSALREEPLRTQLRLALTGVPTPRPTNDETPANHFLPYETHTMLLPNGETLEGWLVPHPQARATVLMFPGHAGAKESLLTPAAVLYEWGYSSLLVDFRGAGGSSRSDTTIGIREGEDVAASLRYARAHWPDQSLVLYGVSMGSSAVLRAVAVDGAQPDALILEGTFDRLRTTVRHRFEAVGVPAFPADLLLFWGSVQTGANAFAHNPVDYAAAVTAPTLLLSGAEDPWILPAEAQAIYDELRGPKTLVLVPGVGHQMPYLFLAGDLWKQQVQGFLATVPPPSP